MAENAERHPVGKGGAQRCEQQNSSNLTRGTRDSATVADTIAHSGHGVHNLARLRAALALAFNESVDAAAEDSAYEPLASALLHVLVLVGFPKEGRAA